MTGVVSAGRKNEDEGLYPVQHGYWLDTMRAAVARERAKAASPTTFPPPAATATTC